jgi:DNA-binding CsgD family transcriptional regulator
LPGFTHTRERPAIVVMIDECHMAFGAVDPDTGATFGHAFGNLDRTFRKAGMGLLAASQIYTLDTFGHDATLRSGLVAGNLLVLRMMEKSHASLLPGESIQPDQIPSGGGWGYSAGSDAVRENIIWRAENNTDPAHWLTAYPRATLDHLSVTLAGPPYLCREEETEQSRVRLKNLLAQMRVAGPVEAARLLREYQGRTTEDESDNVEGSTGPPLGPTWRPPASLPSKPLTERQADVLAAFEGGECSTEELAQRLGISEQMVRQHLTALSESHIVKVRSGVYRPRAETETPAPAGPGQRD